MLEVVINALPTIATTIIVGAIGAYLGHRFTIRRDIALKRREIILPTLISALESLEASNTNKAQASIKKLEDVVNKIQMVGDKTLIELAHKIVIGVTTNGTADTTPMYFALRRKIRTELHLGDVPDKYLALHINTFEDASSPQVSEADQAVEHRASK